MPDDHGGVSGLPPNKNYDEPCVGPKQRIGRFAMETTMALLGQRHRSSTNTAIFSSKLNSIITVFSDARCAEIRNGLKEPIDPASVESTIRTLCEELGGDETAAIDDWRAWNTQHGQLWSYSIQRGPGFESGYAIMDGESLVDIKMLLCS